jgi:signal transduction histidine kinase
MRSPTRQFALLSLLTIGGSTLVFGLVLSHFVEEGLLDREWTSTSAFLRAVAQSHLRPADFVSSPNARPPEAVDHLEEFASQVRMLPEILRVVIYDGTGKAFWTDAERQPRHHGLTPKLRGALAGETVASLESGAPRGRERVEIYVPITFAGEGRVAGVVEAYVDASRVLASVRRARLILWTLAAGSGIVLYVTLYGIVWRASRALRTQHAALAQRADQLARANADLRAVQQQLVAAERLAAFGEVTAAVAHGLGNPLASIRATAQLALLDAPEGPLHDRLTQVIVATDRLRDRMRALLDLGRAVEPRREPTALDTVVHHALESVRPRCSAQGVQLDVAVPPELPKVRLDPSRFEEALLCLVGNALDAMPEGGVLRIAAVASREAPDEPASEVSVEDTGPGMSAAVLARAFDPFFTTKPDGTGLGLAVAKKLLEASGARLSITSSSRGTRAVIQVPGDLG